MTADQRPKYAASFKLTRLHDENAFLSDEVGVFNLNWAELDQINKLVAMLIEQAKEMEIARVGATDQLAGEQEER